MVAVQEFGKKPARAVFVFQLGRNSNQTDQVALFMVDHADR